MTLIDRMLCLVYLAAYTLLEMPMQRLYMRSIALARSKQTSGIFRTRLKPPLVLVSIDTVECYLCLRVSGIISALWPANTHENTEHAAAANCGNESNNSLNCNLL